MAVTQVYEAVPNDVITAARWNNEFGNIYDNGTAIAFPLTQAVSLAGFTLTLDSAGVTDLTSSSAQGFLLAPGAKSGSPTLDGSMFEIEAATFTDTVTAGSGTATNVVGFTINQPTFAATNTSVTTTDAATLYIPGGPVNGTNNTITNPWAIWVDTGNVRFDGGLQGTMLLGKPIGGLTYAPAADASNDMTVQIGECASNDAALINRRSIVLATTITGQIDTGTWVVGTNQPKLDTGTVADVPYYIWLIMRPDTGVVDILFSASGTAPTMPTSYTYKRLIGWFDRIAGVNSACDTYELPGGGLEFAYRVPIDDISSSAVTTSRSLFTLSVPAAFSVHAMLRWVMSDAAIANVNVGCPDETDAAASTSVSPLITIRSTGAGVGGAGQLFVRTSATGTIFMRAVANTIDSVLGILYGFQWSRR